MSIRTSNHYSQAAKSFGDWLVCERRWPENSFDSLQTLNAKTDVRRKRRTLTVEEFSRLVEAAQTSERVLRGLTGSDHAMIYTTAAYTGLRAGELASLERSSLDLDSDVPEAAVEAAYSKRRRKDRQPLRPDLVRMLKTWRVWP